MKKHFCDGCSLELKAGGNVVTHQIKAKAAVGPNKVMVEVLLHAGVDVYKKGVATWGEGELCRSCLMEVVKSLETPA